MTSSCWSASRVADAVEVYDVSGKTPSRTKVIKTGRRCPRIPRFW